MIAFRVTDMTHCAGVIARAIASVGKELRIEVDIAEGCQSQRANR